MLWIVQQVKFFLAQLPWLLHADAYQTMLQLKVQHPSRFLHLSALLVMLGLTGERLWHKVGQAMVGAPQPREFDFCSVLSYAFLCFPMLCYDFLCLPMSIALFACALQGPAKDRLELLQVGLVLCAILRVRCESREEEKVIGGEVLSHSSLTVGHGRMAAEELQRAVSEREGPLQDGTDSECVSKIEFDPTRLP